MDQAMNQTNQMLLQMEKEVSDIYKQASDDISKKWDKYMKSHAPKVQAAHDALEKAMLSGDMNDMQIAKDAYEKIAKNVTLNDEKFKAMVNETTTKLSKTNEVALDYVNGNMAKIYTANYNAFSDNSISGYTFTLVNEQAIKNLATEDKSLLPTKKLNVPKDKQWNTKSINAEVLQGILQGESIPVIAKRLSHVTDMNEKSAIRNARTMVTGAENKGRQDSFKKAESDGVIMKRRWVAAHDDRTRAWHSDLDGVEVNIDEPWENDYGEIMYPGDPTAHPGNVYNCRCSIRSIIKGFDWTKYASSTYTSQYADQYQTIGVTSQYYSMLDEDKAVGNEFWKTLNAEGKPSQVWEDYLAGNTSPEVTAKIDTVLSKYKGTGKPIKPGTAKKVTAQTPKPDLAMYQDKSMTATFYSVKAEDPALGKEFWAILQAEDNPSEVWKQYLSGNASKELTEKLDKILLQHKGTGAWTKPVSVKAAGKGVTKTVIPEKLDDIDDLAKAKSELAIAQGNIDSLGKKTYSGIWKDDVTLADYESKKASIAAKKQYYYDQIEELTHKVDAGDIAEALGNTKISQFEKYIDDLIEFENQGKLYAQYTAEYAKAAKKVKDLTPVSEIFGPDAYTQVRKDNAKWFTRQTYREGDEYYTQTMSDAHKKATKAEQYAYYSYTNASGGFNRPLAGFNAPIGSGPGGWSEKNYVGPGKVAIDNEGKGGAIKNLTSFIEKSVTKDDIWIQTAQNFATLEGKHGFLGIDYGTLSAMTDKELQKFVGTTSEFTQFISGSINRGGGAYTPGSMIFNIYCPSGSEALYVLEDGAFGKAEHEIILQRGGTYRITKMYWGKDSDSGSRKLIVDMDLLTEYGYNKFE